jgi:hypothetical protein
MPNKSKALLDLYCLYTYSEHITHISLEILSSLQLAIEQGFCLELVRCEGMRFGEDIFDDGLLGNTHESMSVCRLLSCQDVIQSLQKSVEYQFTELLTMMLTRWLIAFR